MLLCMCVRECVSERAREGGRERELEREGEKESERGVREKVYFLNKRKLFCAPLNINKKTRTNEK